MGTYNSSTSYEIATVNGRAELVASLDVSAVDDQVATFTYDKGVGSYLNGEYKNATFPWSSDGTGSIIFGNGYIDPWGQRGWNDSIYSIRIYNRSLTTAEIMRNANIDKLRFIDKQGGGYTGTIVGVNLGGTVNDCFSALDILDGAGLVGYNTGVVSNCVYGGNANGRMSAALVGNNTTGASVRNTLSYGTVEGGAVVGGNATNVSDNYVDVQLAPKAIVSTGVSLLNTSDMVGNALSITGFTNGVGYPYLTTFASHNAAKTMAQAAMFVGEANHLTGNITLTGCGDGTVWTATDGVTVSGCSAIVDGRGGAVITASAGQTVYKYLRVNLGTELDNAYLINGLTELGHFRDGINSGKPFYYNPTSGSEDFSNTEQDGWIKVKAQGEGELFLLNADIDLNYTKFTAIGDNKIPFKGTFDGQNHIISHFTNEDYKEDRVGLFRYSQGTIQNVGMVASVLARSQSAVAPLCAANAGVWRGLHRSAVSGVVRRAGAQERAEPVCCRAKRVAAGHREENIAMRHL